MANTGVAVDYLPETINTLTRPDVLSEAPHAKLFIVFFE